MAQNDSGSTFKIAPFREPAMSQVLPWHCNQPDGTSISISAGISFNRYARFVFLVMWCADHPTHVSFNYVSFVILEIFIIR
mmetsp:Transcript_15426/g.25336  ORF Transcript_15426/g.25336 Transcript_15426/m.25336 type:complete len:81 (+) Transcript_15426:753-995(+)